MTTVITSFSRITLIAYILIFTFFDIVLLFIKKNNIAKTIMGGIQNFMMVLFLVNSSVVLFVSTKNQNVFFILIGMLLFFAIASYVYQSMLELFNKPLLNNVFFLFSIGIVELERLDFTKAFKQFIFAIISFILAALIIKLLQLASWAKKIYYVYGLLGILLLTVVTFAGDVEYGAKLSISFGEVSFQPSEFVKILLVFFISTCIYHFRNLVGFLIASVVAAIEVLILMKSNDFGTALIFLCIYVFMIFVSYKSYSFLLASFLIIGIGAKIAYNLFPHIQTRVLAWKDPLSVVDDQGYQICQSLFAIGTGGWLGSGINNGSPTKIPVVAKDFIYAAISEEFGAIFALTLILIFLITSIMVFLSSIEVEDAYYKLVCYGLGIMFIMQALLNIGGVIKFIPSTGVTLPFISYGGSSLLSMIVSFSIILAAKSLYAEEQKELKRAKKREKRERHETNRDIEDQNASYLMTNNKSTTAKNNSYNYFSKIENSLEEELYDEINLDRLEHTKNESIKSPKERQQGYRVKVHDFDK